jgi:hypothetical protein
MVIAFYIEVMNLRGVANSIFLYSKYNEEILKNKSIIFYNKKNNTHNKKVIKKFQKRFKVLGINNFLEIDNYHNKFKIEYIYTQTGGEKTDEVSNNIKTLVHFVYPQKFSEIHGHKYISVSNWLSKQFANNKIPVLPYIVQLNKTKKDLRKKLRIKKNQTIIGCHGGESSFDLKFVQETLVDLVKKKNDITFVFLNINKFCNHSRIIFLKGTSDEIFKKQFLNTCDAMIYGRSLGESFGMSCGEFASLNKLIISYKYNRHRSHIDYLSKDYYIEYHSRKSLFSILNKFNKKKKLIKNKKNDYLKCTPKIIMKIFKKLLSSKPIKLEISSYDYLINFIGFCNMNYYYIRHKIYNHFYKFIESKFL